MVVALVILSTLASSTVPVAVEPAGAPVPIVGGASAEPGAWPDAAGIVYRGGVVACSGTLIAPDLVLTARHCLDNGPIAVALDTVALDDPGEIIDVLGTWEAPPEYDAALLVLTRPSTVRPRVIARGCALEGVVARAPVTAVGFGAIDVQGTRWPTELRQVGVDIVEPRCDDVGAGCSASLPPHAELIAGGDGRDTCRGDSGGPLYLPTHYGEFLIGVTVRGRSDAEEACGGGGIYLRADHLAELIEAGTARVLPTPGCSVEPASTDADPAVEGDESGAGCSATGAGRPLGPSVFVILFGLWSRRSMRGRPRGTGQGTTGP